MAAEMPDDVRALFERPNYAQVATLMPDGSPHMRTGTLSLVEPERVFAMTLPFEAR